MYHLKPLKTSVYSAIRNETAEAPNYKIETQSTLTVQHWTDTTHSTLTVQHWTDTTRMSSKLRSLNGIEITWEIIKKY